MINSFSGDHAYAPPMEIEEEEDLTPRRHTNRNRRYLLLNTLLSRTSNCFCSRSTLLLLVFLISIIFAAILSLGSHSIDSEGVGSSSPRDPPTVIEHYDPREIDIHNRLHVISGQAIYEQGSPQYQAANWIIKEDYMINRATDSFLTQRYVLVILYFQSEARLTKEWQTWLNTAGSECFWDGIECVNGIVSVIKLGA